MRWHRLSLLLDQIQSSLDDFRFNFDWNWLLFYSYFTEVKSNKIHSQKGVIRSNCVDSIDRTNVVQSVIARRALLLHLKELSEVDFSTANVPDQQLPFGLEFFFRNLWADNADAISKQYSGTGAMKTDFTR